MDSRWFFIVIAGCALPALGKSTISSVKQAQNKTSNCPPLYTPIADQCLYFESLTKGTWTNMETTCQLFGGRLAKLDTVEVFSQAVAYINGHELSDFNFWIGASDALIEGEWLWMDGSPVQMGVPLWHHCSSSGEPDGGTSENCAALMGGYSNLYMQDEQCTREYYGICEPTDFIVSVFMH